jgi:hypothetical protein
MTIVELVVEWNLWSHIYTYIRAINLWHQWQDVFAVSGKTACMYVVSTRLAILGLCVCVCVCMYYVRNVRRSLSLFDISDKAVSESLSDRNRQVYATYIASNVFFHSLSVRQFSSYIHTYIHTYICTMHNIMYICIYIYIIYIYILIHTASNNIVLAKNSSLLWMWSISSWYIYIYIYIYI